MIQPEIIHKPNVVISGSRYIGSCDSLILNVGSSTGNMGKSLYYRWSTNTNRLEWNSESGTGESASKYVLTQGALQTFGVNILRIELYTENWVCFIISLY